MNTLATLSTLLALVAIGAGLWAIVRKRNKPGADIDRQIATLRKHADHAVQHRPRVRANTCHSTPGHIKAAPAANVAKPKACGGGMCRHQADCSDHYCPGRMAANLSGKS
jgi:hypothetical protein